MKIKDGFIIRELADSYVVVSVDNKGNNFNGMIQLNKTAAFIFEQLQTEKSKDEVVKAMLEKYDLDQEKASEDFDNFVKILAEADLLA